MALWTPANTTDTKQVWLKADDSGTISESAGAVASWTDKFNSYVFSQASAGLKPTTGATTLNSKNVIDFAGDYLTSTAAASTWNFLHNGTKYRIYAVVKLGTISDPDAFYVVLGTSGGGASGNRGVVLSFDDRVSVPRNERLVHAVSRGTAGTFNTENISADGFCAPNTPLMAGVRADPSNATAASRSTLVLNDDTTASNNAATGSASASNATYTLQIGAGGNAVGPLTGYIAELIIVSGDLDADEDDRFWGYMAHEWALTADLPIGHPYKTSAPTFGTTSMTLTATTHASASIEKFVIFAKSMTANISMIASIDKLVTYARTLSSTITIAAIIKRDITKHLTSTISTSATSIKSITKSIQSSITSSAILSTGNLVELTATITMSAELLALRIFTKALQATATANAFISRIAAKTLSAVSHAQALLSRIAQKNISSSVSIAPNISKTPTKHLTASSTVAAIRSGLVTRLRTLSSTSTVQAIIQKLPYKILTASITASANFMRRVYKILTAEITVTPSLIYDITRIVREYLWARQESVTLWATNKSERIIAVSKDALLLAKQTTKRLWK